MLLNTLKSLNSVDRIQTGMTCPSFNDNSYTTIVFCYSPINNSDETDIITFYKKLSFLVRHISNQNVLIIGGDMNGHTGKDEINIFCLHNPPNRNGAYLAEFSLENRLAYLNTKFQKREGKLWIYHLPK